MIGNPPDVRHELFLDLKRRDLEKHYKTYNGLADLYVYFVEQGFLLLKKKGVFSYIIGNKWMRSNYGKPLRNWLKNQMIEEIIDFGDLPVFRNATTYPCIIRISKKQASKIFRAIQVDKLNFSSLDTVR